MNREGKDMAELGGVAVRNGEELTDGAYAVRWITGGYVITREDDRRVLSHIYRQLDTAVKPWRTACTTKAGAPDVPKEKEEAIGTSVAGQTRKEPGT